MTPSKSLRVLIGRPSRACSAALCSEALGIPALYTQSQSLPTLCNLFDSLGTPIPGTLSQKQASQTLRWAKEQTELPLRSNDGLIRIPSPTSSALCDCCKASAQWTMLLGPDVNLADQYSTKVNVGSVHHCSLHKSQPPCNTPSLVTPSLAGRSFATSTLPFCVRMAMSCLYVECIVNYFRATT